MNLKKSAKTAAQEKISELNDFDRHKLEDIFIFNRNLEPASYLNRSELASAPEHIWI